MKTRYRLELATAGGQIINQRCHLVNEVNLMQMSDCPRAEPNLYAVGCFELTVVHVCYLHSRVPVENESNNTILRQLDVSSFESLQYCYFRGVALLAFPAR